MFYAKLEDSANAGARFLVDLYGGDTDKETLAEVRHKRFKQSITKRKLTLLPCHPHWVLNGIMHAVKK